MNRARKKVQQHELSCLSMPPYQRNSVTENSAIDGRKALLGSVIAGINAVCLMRTNRLS